MRELKFRAWHDGGKYPDEAEMIYDNQYYVFKWLYEGQPVTVMQFTGLKDKNGADIYEGDIVKLNYFNGSKSKEHVEVVEFKDGRFDLTWTINKLFKSFRSRSCFHGHPDAFEVIGNIYENPELLK